MIGRRIQAGCALVGVALATMLLSEGCTQLTPRRLAMVPAPDSYSIVDCAKTLAMRPTIGGEESDIWAQDGLPRVSNSYFTFALRTTLKAAGYALHDSVDNGADYELRAEVINEPPPLAGPNVASALTVRYTLYLAHGRTPVWQQSVTSTYEVGFFVDILGTRRYSLAVEGAARENIIELLRLLGPVVARGV